MSTRALRRMQAAQAPADQDADEAVADEGETEEPLPSGGSKIAGNKFDFLADDEDQPEIGDESEEEVAQQQPNSTSKAAKKKKKKASKKTAKKDTTATVDDDELILEQAVQQAAAASATDNEYFDDNIVKNSENATGKRYLCSRLGLNVKDAMSLNPKFLNSAHEVQYRFGTQVAGPANVQRGHRGGQHRAGVHSRLITPRPNWPLLGRTGLSMRQLDQPSAAGLPTFTFEHDNAYAAAQQEFWAAVETLSPEEIAGVHRKYPYHIDTLLQLAELCITADDWQSASDIVERAVYAMEANIHHNFILTRLGSRVLDFRYFESRSFYLALFRHITILGRKGCTRTACELSKLLLSLDFRRDPMCALLLLDFYALRANCNAELIAIYDDLVQEKSLDWLPNFAYSVPLACFRLSQAVSASSSAASSSLSSSRLPSASTDVILAVAKSLMFEALTRFPSVLVPLLESCSVKPDGSLAKCKWFVASQADAKDEPNALKALQALYVIRCGMVWKDMDTLRWLESVVAEFVESMPTEEASRRAVRERALAAFQQPCGRNVMRHLVLSGHREPIGYVSSELPFTAAIFSYDPLPPQDAIWTYTRTNPRRGRGANADATPLDLFASFFASMLPNYNPAEQAQVQVRFDNFLHAFRNVLAGLHLEPPPFDPAQQQQQQQQQVPQERPDLADLTDSSEEGDNNRAADNDELE